MENETTSPTAIDDNTFPATILSWLALADDDYVAARTLILSDLLVQGAIFSSTAIEKYLKLIYKIKRLNYKRNGDAGHDVTALYNKLVEGNHTELELNISYLELMRKTYRARYVDTLPDGFNFAINKCKLLVGLDETVHRIRIGFRIERAKRPLRFENWLSDSYQPLLQFNHCFGAAKRSDLFIGNTWWQELRIINGNHVAMHYAGPAIDDGLYNLDGMRRGATEFEFQLQSPPSF